MNAEQFYVALILWLEQEIPNVAWHRKGDDDVRPDHVPRDTEGGQYGTVFISREEVGVRTNAFFDPDTQRMTADTSSSFTNRTVDVAVYRLDKNLYPADTLRTVLQRLEIDRYTQDEIDRESLAGACNAVQFLTASSINSTLVPNQRVHEPVAVISLTFLTEAGTLRESDDRGTIDYIDSAETSCIDHLNGLDTEITLQRPQPPCKE